MKLPRWLVIIVMPFFVLVAIVGLAYVWIVWPVNTAEHFVQLVRNGHIEEANRMLLGGSLIAYGEDGVRLRIEDESSVAELWGLGPSSAPLILAPHSCKDMIQGKQEITVSNWQLKEMRMVPFVAFRDYVIAEPAEWQIPFSGSSLFVVRKRKPPELGADERQRLNPQIPR